MNFWLWAVQILLAFAFGAAGIMKIVTPIEAFRARPQMAWAATTSTAMVKFIGLAEVLGAVGMILPILLDVLPWLTPLAAIGFIVLQVLAIIVHARRGEMQVLPANIVLIALSAFVAIGRWDLFGA